MARALMSLEDRDLRRAIRSELRRGDFKRLGPLIEAYAKDSPLGALVGKVTEHPNSTAYQERFCFFPANRAISTLLEAILLDIFREEFRGLDPSMKDNILRGILLVYNKAFEERDLIRMVLSLQEGIPTTRPTPKEMVPGFTVNPFERENRVSFDLDPYGEGQKFTTHGVIMNYGAERLLITEPDTVLSPVFEWAIITLARLCGFRELAFKLGSFEDTKPYVTDKGGSFFLVSNEEGLVVVKGISAIESEDGLILSPSLIIRKSGLFFGELEIGKTSDPSHSIPLERLIEESGKENAAQ